MAFGTVHLEMQDLRQEAHDIMRVERRDDVRLVVSIAGRYSLANRRDRNGNRRVFACRLVNISSQGMALAVPVIGAKGERVIVHTDLFGRTDGAILRLLDGGFVMSIVATADDRAKLQTKIAWMAQHINHDLPDGRQNARIVPRQPISSLILADGSVPKCFVIDMSASGVAVSAEIIPEIGTPVAVGKVLGRVVRHFAQGFAVQFFDEQNRTFSKNW